MGCTQDSTRKRTYKNQVNDVDEKAYTIVLKTVELSDDEIKNFINSLDKNYIESWQVK